MLSVYAKLSSRLLVRKRERGLRTCKETGVFTLARLKIVLTIKNMYRIQCQYVD